MNKYNCIFQRSALMEKYFWQSETECPVPVTLKTSYENCFAFRKVEEEGI